jgi:nucleoside-triphosphatase THEP1
MYDRVKMCAKGTRMELLDDLMQWAQSTDPDAAQIYWLNGQAGMGKSTIASTFSNLLKEQHKLGGDFFFSRSVAERSITQGVFVTIAYQLATRIPGIKDAICDAVEEEPDVGNLAVSTQWKSLIKGPLLKSAANLGVGFVIVMDALDECIAPLEIIENIESDISSLPPAFKIFCTSRPENNLEVAFKALGQRVKEYPLSATDANVTRDIRTFITERMKRISRKYDLEDDEEWPGDERRETLVRKAAGLFIWVTTASEFIEDDEVGDPEGQLQVILDDVIEPHAATSPWHSLDSLYIQVLRQALSERAPDFRRKLYHQVVGAIVTIRNPLSVSALAHLLDIQAHGGNSATKLVEQTIGKIRAVLFIPKSEHDVIRTIHKSFADFLTNRERCTDERLYIDPVLQHQYLATRCLQIMDQLLTPYICDIDPSLLNSDIDDFKSRYLKHIPPALRYACTFWGEHLHSSFPIPALFPLVKKFYNHHLLAWLEVLSLTGLVDSGPGTLAMAYKWLGVR